MNLTHPMARATAVTLILAACGSDPSTEPSLDASANDASLSDASVIDAHIADSSVIKKTDATAGDSSMPVATNQDAGGSVSYSTLFNLSESPISEGGVWKHNNPWFTTVVTSGGSAYGTEPNPANNNLYQDSYAYLGGMGFPPNQYASGTIYKNGTTGGYMEVELQLRVSDTANSTQGYECFLHQGGAYISVARWKGAALTAPATISYFDILGGANNITAPKDGDLYEAQIVGNMITVKLAGQTILTVDVSAFDGVVLPSGDPGIGFDAGASGAETADSSYGLKDFFAKGL